MKKAVWFVWGQMLLAEGSFLTYAVLPLFSNRKIKKAINLRILAVCITGWNLLTDGKAWPNFPTF
jgi:hypothetical protein